MEKRPLDYYKALYKIASEVGSTLPVEKELSALVKSTAKAIGAKGCSILLLTDDEGKLVHMASCGLSDSYIRKGLVDLDPITAEALRGKPMIVRDATTDSRVQYQEQAKMEGIVSMISLPLMIHGRVAGILRVYTDHLTQFSAADIAFLSGIANSGATAIGKDQMYAAMEEHYKNSLKEKTEELASLEEAKNKLIGSISVVAHDLKSPLAAIQSYFKVMLGGYAGELSEKQQQMIERSSVRIDELLNLISDLLDLSRIEMGQITQEMDDLSLDQIMESAIESIRVLADEKHIAMTLNIQRDLPHVRGSANRLQQVLANLLGNAIKFMPDGGSVILQLSETNGKILCTIRDTGIGIPEEDIPHIFEDFYRAGNVEKGSGTGLGLSIAKRIIQAHGGEIWVKSPCADTGVGSEFVFTLPISGSGETECKTSESKE